MSNLTDFFPGTEGGGGAVSFDPMTLDRRVVRPDYLNIQVTATAGANSVETQFWTIYYGSVYDYVDMGSNTGYVTLKDVTSAPKGGRLHHVISPVINYSGASQEINFRITVDGTEYIVTALPSGNNWGQNCRAVLGGAFYSKETTSSAVSMEYAIGNAYRSYYGGDIYSENGSGGFFNPNSLYSELKIPSEPYLFNGIYFKETLKVEVQCSNIYQAGSAYTSAGAAVSIF